MQSQLMVEANCQRRFSQRNVSGSLADASLQKLTSVIQVDANQDLVTVYAQSDDVHHLITIYRTLNQSFSTRPNTTPNLQLRCQYLKNMVVFSLFENTNLRSSKPLENDVIHQVFISNHNQQAKANVHNMGKLENNAPIIPIK